ncbi:hypothetical protein [Nocardioides sp. Soil796]|uniref:hypothetical protein n=1 Tax=Nocardioides sp. Soil796 TaxID=1736412 RepID=UPI000709F8AE|nr:hypothetical protein [Nocardioides sp. Soil796]KRF10918.1 hypothetical protein ASH02_18935 [Nocardioides sp. Soil796]
MSLIGNSTAPDPKAEGGTLLESNNSPTIVPTDDLHHGVHGCPGCGRQWDAIWFRTTTCTCGTTGVPTPAPPERAASDDPPRHPRDILFAAREARRAKAATGCPSDGPPRHPGVLLFGMRDAERAAKAGPPRPRKAGSKIGRLRGLSLKVRNAPTGERNTVLHWAACRAGEMVAAGEVDEATVVGILHDAGIAAGLTPNEVGDSTWGTIGSGLRTGMGEGAE